MPCLDYVTHCFFNQQSGPVCDWTRSQQGEGKVLNLILISIECNVKTES